MTFQTLINRPTPHTVSATDGEGVRSDQAGFAILHGTLSPEGCVVRPMAFPSQVFDGPARVFSATRDAVLAIRSGRIRSTDILIVRHDGRDSDLQSVDDMHLVSSALEAEGLDRVTIITDGRTHSLAEGAIISQVAPSAAAGGPIAYVNDDDIIHIDIATRRIDILAEIDIRRGVKLARAGTKSFGAFERYARLVSSASGK